MIRDAIEKKIVTFVTFVTLRLTPPPNLTKNTMYFLRDHFLKASLTSRLVAKIRTAADWDLLLFFSSNACFNWFK